MTHLSKIFVLSVLLPMLVGAQAAPRSPSSNNVKPAISPQTQSPLTPAFTPQLSTAERVALATCEKQKQDALKQWQDAVREEQNILAEFSTAHPGYHLNEATFAVEPNQQKPAPPASK
jgi:hypothetical protein